MAVSIQDFIRTNKVFLIWTIFFAFLYLIRGLFGLVFLTFILCYIFNNVIEWLTARLRLPRRVWTVVVYLAFAAAVTAALSALAPKLGSEGTAFVRQMPENLEEIREYLDQQAAAYPEWTAPLMRLKEYVSLEKLVGVDRQALVSLAVRSLNQVGHYFSYFLLGTLFSFFILLDYPNLRRRALALQQTRLREVYEETAESVVQFALVVGAAFQAQIMIACVNTVLTAIGLLLLEIEPVGLLSLVVFVAGLIPVLGVFISSVPILLLAFNSGGIHIMAAALAWIVGVHIVEAYILNPNIFSAVLRINPVLTLIILYIGHSLFGLWGVLLGVPVSVYIYRYSVQGRNFDGERSAAACKAEEEAGEAENPA